ncbi:hypothetical protein HMJ29_10820 [Hymenobacter taeanensis]|uniref:Macro domain-containing protein n=1 Tax=Hymenobacter taeanensis TaxID=2735321 RepID=A0A6M6BJB7_9BACT|nr:hypothetical protein HMJ29_10820 [Hymenobacter taeanensis]
MAAASFSLLGGVEGGYRAGSPEILAARQKLRANHYSSSLATGEAVITTGGCLPVRYVIHTVGLVWTGGHKS